MKRLTVRADSRTYPILVGRDVLGRLGAEVRRLRGDGQVVILCDENVAPLYLEQARESLVEAGLLASHVILAMVIVPLILVTMTHAAKARYEQHRAWARWTRPLWLYVSVTGVLVYFMLSRWFPRA